MHLAYLVHDNSLFGKESETQKACENYDESGEVNSFDKNEEFNRGLHIEKDQKKQNSIKKLEIDCRIRTLCSSKHLPTKKTTIERKNIVESSLCNREGKPEWFGILNSFKKIILASKTDPLESIFTSDDEEANDNNKTAQKEASSYSAGSAAQNVLHTRKSEMNLHQPFNLLLVIPLLLNALLLLAVVISYIWYHDILVQFLDLVYFSDRRSYYISISSFLTLASVLLLSSYPSVTKKSNLYFELINSGIYLVSYGFLLIMLILNIQLNIPNGVVYGVLLLCCAIGTYIFIITTYVCLKTHDSLTISMILGFASTILIFICFSLRRESPPLIPFNTLWTLLLSFSHIAYTNLNFKLLLIFRAKKYAESGPLRILGDMWTDLLWNFPEELSLYIKFLLKRHK